MAYDLQTLGAKKIIGRSKRDANIIMPMKGYIITDKDDIEFQIKFIEYDTFDAIWIAEDASSERNMRFSSKEKTFRVFKEI